MSAAEWRMRGRGRRCEPYLLFHSRESLHGCALRADAFDHPSVYVGDGFMELVRFYEHLLYIS